MLWNNEFEQLSRVQNNAGRALWGFSNVYANPRPVPRILLEGADSIGAWGALARVYLEHLHVRNVDHSSTTFLLVFETAAL